MDTQCNFIGLPRSFNVTQSVAPASAAIIFTVNLSRTGTSSCRVPDLPFSFSTFSALVFSHHLHVFTLYHFTIFDKAPSSHKMKTWKHCRGTGFRATPGKRWDCRKQRKISGLCDNLKSWGLEKVLETDEGKTTRWEDSCKSVTRERNEQGAFYEKIMMREWAECKG